MNPPAVLIRLPLEGSPEVVCDYLTEGEAVRMGDWFAGHPEYLELVDRAHELAERERAA